MGFAVLGHNVRHHWENSKFERMAKTFKINGWEKAFASWSRFGNGKDSKWKICHFTFIEEADLVRVRLVKNGNSHFDSD